eukprot:7305966-Alexandrium_andersonii.AAC.1
MHGREAVHRMRTPCAEACFRDGCEASPKLSLALSDCLRWCAGVLDPSSAADAGAYARPGWPGKGEW